MASQTTLATGTLVASLPVLENGLWWCGDHDHASERWWLGAPIGAEADAEFVDSLLADPDFCQVHSASIDARRSCVGEDVLDDEAQLSLRLCLRLEAIAEVIPMERVSPASMRALATVRRNAYVLATDPGMGLPVVCLRCAERLTSVDLRQFVGEQEEVRAEAWVFVDRRGQPFDSNAVMLPPAANDEGSPLADRLAALRELSLLVRIRRGEASVVLRLRADRLWLLSGLHADGDCLAHRSRWHLQGRPWLYARPPANDVPGLASLLRLRQDQYERRMHPVLIDSAFLVKAALTPVTLALDIVLGAGLDELLHGASGDSPAPTLRR